MGISLRRRWKFSSSICNWHDGYAFRNSEFTTFVRSISNSPNALFPTYTSFFCRVLVMMIVLGTIWVFVPKTRKVPY